MADFVPPQAKVADIGADHGFLALHLMATGRARQVVASEVRPGPYQIMCQAVISSPWAQHIDLRLGDGLAVLTPGEVDLVVLAGMGGHTVCDILNVGTAVLKSLKRLIIQPMRDVALVRRWLLERGWRLVDEELVQEDGRYYVVLVAEPGQEVITDGFILKTGPRLLEKRSALLYRYLIRRHWQLTVLLRQLQGGFSIHGGRKALEVGEEIKKIKEVLQHW